MFMQVRDLPRTAIIWFSSRFRAIPELKRIEQAGFDSGVVTAEDTGSQINSRPRSMLAVGTGELEEKSPDAVV